MPDASPNGNALTAAPSGYIDVHALAAAAGSSKRGRSVGGVEWKEDGPYWRLGPLYIAQRRAEDAREKKAP